MFDIYFYNNLIMNVGWLKFSLFEGSANAILNAINFTYNLNIDFKRKKPTICIITLTAFVSYIWLLQYVYQLYQFNYICCQLLIYNRKIFILLYAFLRIILATCWVVINCIMCQTRYYQFFNTANMLITILWSTYWHYYFG